MTAIDAKNIDFLNIGKKPVTDNNVPDAPTDTPKGKWAPREETVGGHFWKERN